MGEGDGIEMSAGVSFARSLTRVAAAAAAAVVEEAVVHLEPAERIPADVTSQGMIGWQGGRERVGVCLGRKGARVRYEGNGCQRRRCGAVRREAHALR